MVIAIPGEKYEITSEELAQSVEQGSDIERIESLFFAALADFDICHRILLHDQQLLELFRISPEMQQVITGQYFHTLAEIAAAVLSAYEQHHS